MLSKLNVAIQYSTKVQFFQKKPKEVVNGQRNLKNDILLKILETYSV